MFGELSIALLLAAAPATTQDAPPADPPQAEEPATDPKSAPYKLKKVCRAQEQIGSSIPRMICSTKRIYLKPGEESQAENKSKAEPRSQN